MKSEENIQKIYKPFLNNNNITNIEFFDKYTKFYTPNAIYKINNDIIPNELTNTTYDTGMIVKLKNFGISVIVGSCGDYLIINSEKGNKLISNDKISFAHPAFTQHQEKILEKISKRNSNNKKKNNLEQTIKLFLGTDVCKKHRKKSTDIYDRRIRTNGSFH